MTEIASPLSKDEEHLGAQSATAVDAAGSIAPDAAPHAAPVAECGCVYHAEQGIPCEHDKALARHVASHTPGPWRVEVRSGRARAMYGDCIASNHYSHGGVIDGRDLICDCRGPHGEANAHLIAAAPELLKALKSLLALDAVRELWDDGPLGEGWQSDELSGAIAAGDAAIAKAEGKG